jgi:hypothetical protein
MTVTRMKLCVSHPLEVKGMGIKRGRRGKKVRKCILSTLDIIFQW